MGSVIKTDRGTWQARWRDPAGVQRKQTFPRKLDADRHLAGVEGAKAAGAYLDPAAGLITVEEFAATYLAARAGTWRATTAESAATVLTARVFPILGHRRLRDLTTTELQAFVGELAGSYAPSTVETTWSHLRQILRAAHRDRRIPWDPGDGVRLPRPDPGDGDGRAMMIPTRAEAFAILAAAPARWRAAIALGVGCGMRVGEVLGLSADRCDLDRARLRVDRQLQKVGGRLTLVAPKTARGRRTIVVPSMVALELRRHLRDHPSPDWEGLLFVGRRGARLPRSEFYATAWRPALTGAGIDRDLRFHDLRHFACSTLLSAGVPPTAVAAYVGDTVETILRVYAHALRDDRELPRLALDAALAPDPDQAAEGGHTGP